MITFLVHRKHRVFPIPRASAKRPHSRSHSGGPLAPVRPWPIRRVVSAMAPLGVRTGSKHRAEHDIGGEFVMAMIASYEDDSGIAEVLECYIREAGWDWRLIPDTDQMLGLLRELKPDLVTTGNRQGEMSGPAFAAALKADPALREIPLVFVTAMSDQNYLWAQLRKHGLDPDRQIAGYVVKPFDRAELVEAIQRALAASVMKLALPLEEIIANLLSNGPPIAGPEPLGKPGISDLLLGRRFFRSTLWDEGFRAASPVAQAEILARILETDAEVSRWFHSQVARHGTKGLLVLAIALRK